MRLDVRAFPLTCGVVWGLGLPLLTWWIMAFDGPSTDLTWIGHIYRGYDVTFVASLIGGVWAFFERARWRRDLRVALRCHRDARRQPSSDCALKDVAGMLRSFD